MPLVLAAAEPDVWRWAAHPEVWLLIAGIVGLGVYATRVVGPNAVHDGAPIVTRSQVRYFVAAVVVLWIAADWPVHDIGERYLYWVHMLQHLLITVVAAPLFLLATPEWLARLVVGDGGQVHPLVRKLCRPLVAGLLYNVYFVFTHWPAMVDASVQSAPLHYALHVGLFATAMLMWIPVCGPLPELRISPPAQMLYLFCMSIVPTVPSAWLIFAEKPIYTAYVHPYTVWGLDAVQDQQTAGVLMKLGAGIFLWVVIGVLFVRWAKASMAENKAAVRVVTRGDVLLWDDVADELSRPGPPDAVPPATPPVQASAREPRGHPFRD